MNRGVVMEVAGTYVIVLTPDGRFRKVPRMAGNDRIGEEIQFAIRSYVRRIWLSSLAAVACAALFGLIWFAGFGGSQGSLVAAYVTLDINPSLEFGIDDEEKVIEASGLNDDGIRLLEGLVYKGKTLDSVTESVMQRVEEQGFFRDDEGDVVITSTMVKDDPKLDETKLTDKMNDQVSRIIRNASPAQADKVKITTLAAPREVRQEAQNQGVSTGKMAVYLIAKNEGRDVTIEQMKTTSIHQIAKSWGGLQQVIDNKKKPDKDTLKKMLEQEQKKEKRKKEKEKEKENKEKEKEEQRKNNGNKPDDHGPKGNHGKGDVKPTNGSPDNNRDSGKGNRNNEDSKLDFEWKNSAAYKKWQDARKKWQEERKKHHGELKKQFEEKKKQLEDLKRQAEMEKKNLEALLKRAETEQKKRAEENKAEAKKQAEEKKKEEERKKEEREKEKEKQQKEQQKEERKKEQEQEKKKEQDNKNRKDTNSNNSREDKGNRKDDNKHDGNNGEQQKDRNRERERD